MRTSKLRHTNWKRMCELRQRRTATRRRRAAPRASTRPTSNHQMTKKANAHAGAAKPVGRPRCARSTQGCRQQCSRGA
eukprot:4341644-Prymnesium_polylepis.1